MKCPQCVKDDLRSKMFPGRLNYSVMGGTVQQYYDEDGEWHSHDVNAYDSYCHCSQGHKWINTIYNECSCGWRYGDDSWKPRTSGG